MSLAPGCAISPILTTATPFMPVDNIQRRTGARLLASVSSLPLVAPARYAGRVADIAAAAAPTSAPVANKALAHRLHGFEQLRFSAHGRHRVASSASQALVALASRFGRAVEGAPRRVLEPLGVDPRAVDRPESRGTRRWTWTGSPAPSRSSRCRGAATKTTIAGPNPGAGGSTSRTSHSPFPPGACMRRRTETARGSAQERSSPELRNASGARPASVIGTNSLHLEHVDRMRRVFDHVLWPAARIAVHLLAPVAAVS
jgi:hypothetical protein